ncbi:hypothetical protein ASU96_24660 [Enterobacter hormaechei subsp. xiangfangensis]|nr:hypothetical protein ASU96_24660 [Enterobacter hormaechei subsp. xiangfangensis]
MQEKVCSVFTVNKNITLMLRARKSMSFPFAASHHLLALIGSQIHIGEVIIERGSKTLILIYKGFVDDESFINPQF